MCTCAMPMEKALGESRHRSQTSGWGKSFIRIVKSDRQPNTTVSKEPTVLANLGFLNNGVIMKEKKICEETGGGDVVRDVRDQMVFRLISIATLLTEDIP